MGIDSNTLVHDATSLMKQVLVIHEKKSKDSALAEEYIAGRELYVGIVGNANCYLEQASEFVTAAAAAGLDYPTLINKIVDLAVERYGQGI